MQENTIDWIKHHFKQVEAIFFDFDNTLVDENYSVKNRWDVILAKYQNITNNNKLRETFFKIYKEKGQNYKYHVDDTLDCLNISKKYKKSIIDEFLCQTSTDESVYPYAEEVLEVLSNMHLKLAMFTNGLKKNQEHRIKISGISDFFKYIQYGDTYKLKPDLNSFMMVSKQLNLSNKRKFIMIGDSYNDDFLGAKRCGAECILINSEIKNNFSSPVYSSLKELYEDLKQI